MGTEGESFLEHDGAWLPISPTAGEELPPLRLVLRDGFGNPVGAAGAAAAPPLRVWAAVQDDDAGQLVQCPELAVVAQQEADSGGIVLSGIQVLGSEEAAAAKQGGVQAGGRSAVGGRRARGGMG